MCIVRRRPNLPERDIFTSKEVCNILEVTSRTLRRYRSRGWIHQNNEGNMSRPLYTGKEIMNCWDNVVVN